MSSQAKVSRRLLPIEDAATYLGMTAWAMRHRINQGLLPYIRMGRRIYLDIKDLDELIERLKVSYD
ncbi:MAG: helix-turn-helix domain-containing protein [Candidatus Geothermincolia bacterium]